MSDNGMPVGRLTLRVLGAFRAERKDGPVPPGAWQRPTARTLVKLLAVQPGHRLHEDQVLELLWPDLTQASALSSLRKATTFARQALEPDLPSRGTSSFLRLSGGLLSLNGENVWIDADQFELQARAALSGGDDDIYRAALDCYEDDLLPEDLYEEWTLARRDELKRLYRRLLLSWADCLEVRGAPEAAIDALQRVLRHDPLQEDIHRRLMRLFVAAGDRQACMGQYEALVHTLQTEGGGEPEAETIGLFREISSARASSVPIAAPSADHLQGTAHCPAPLRRTPSAPLVGRERSLQMLAAEFARAAGERESGASGGRGGVVLVGGEAGVGKTRLVTEAARAAHGRGALVLWGASYEQEGQAPYFPFVEAFERYLETCAPHVRQSLAVQFPDLARLLPGLSEEEERPSLPAGSGLSERDGRLRLFASVVRFLDHLTSQGPLFLVLDDLYLGDEGTLQLLHHLARAAPDRPWLIVGTYREEDVVPGSSFDGLQLSLARASLSRTLELLRLSRSDCSAIVTSLLPGGVPDDALLERIYALSLGNALFAGQLVEALKENGLHLQEGRWTCTDGPFVVPTQIQQLIASRISRLGPGTQHILNLAAVCGMEADFTVLQSGSKGDEEELLDALDAALAARVLEEHGNGLTFSHPLVREAIYCSLSATRRTYLHGVIARAIEQHRPGDLDALAFHYGKSTRREAAVIYMEKAADRARDVYATEAAEALYEGALQRLQGEGAGWEGEARIQDKLGKLLIISGRNDEGLELLERAAALYRERGDLEGLIGTMAKIGLAHAVKGTPDEALERTVTLLDSLGPCEPSEGLANLHLALSNLYAAKGHLGDGLLAVEKASSLARCIGADFLLAGMEATRGTQLLMLERVTEGRAVMDSAIELSERTGNLVALNVALNNMGVSYSFAADYARATQYVRRSLEGARRVGNPAKISMALSNLAWILIRTGEWKEARSLLVEALQIVRKGTLDRESCTVLQTIGYLDLVEGRWREARETLEENIQVADHYGTPEDQLYSRTFLAELDLLEGRPADALSLVQPFLCRGQTIAADVLYSPEALAAWAHLELGHVEKARELVDGAAARAEGEQKPLRWAYTLGVQARVLDRQGHAEAAVESLERARESMRSASYPYGEAQMHAIQALICRDRRENGRARHHLAKALAIFRRLGLHTYMERVTRAFVT